MNSAAIPFPDSGLALDGLLELTEGVDLHGGLYQANCKKASFGCLEDLTSSEHFVPLEIRASRSLLDGEEGNYRLMGFYRESEGRTGHGWSFSFDQTLGPVQAFLRGSFADGEISDFETAWSMGASFAAPLGRSHDAIGLGWARGEPKADKPNEELVELFWRFQVHRYVSISPDVQWVKNPADNPDEDNTVVLGVRLLISL